MSTSQIAIRIPPPRLQECDSLSETLRDRYIRRIGTSKTDVVVSAMANYLDGLESIPLTQRITELELKVQKLEAARSRN
ncbi:DNA-binding domain-containing protein [Merismopedia glauca]|uniref:DNA-binding domain-containing protein n=1 Tax=Merismopedia glauca CCAP 1448/3 TaxID=1296344 RepID=A0A2T1C0A3_9CYAN|nr:DNA-binding domain-containing protein [Merismopedia glauca]PSB01634.1 DNA-binding domain-containing protein [Merismopedia glauca CCAP 1448/3]